MPPFNFRHINALAYHGFRPTPNFHVHKEEPRPAEDVAKGEGAASAPAPSLSSPADAAKVDGVVLA